MLQPSFPTLTLEAQIETLNVTCTVSNDYINVLIIIIVIIVILLPTSAACHVNECKSHVFPLILCKDSLISHNATFFAFLSPTELCSILVLIWFIQKDVYISRRF